MRRNLLVAGLLTSLLATGLSACTRDDPAAAPAPDAGRDVASAPPAWNPCSGLDVDPVSRLFAATYSVRLGTPDAPTCTFAPLTDGDPLVDVNYQTYPGSLAELLRTFGAQEQPGRTRVIAPRVPGADDARLIVDASADTLAVTGFVRNGLLVQILNLLDPRPYDRAQLLRAAERLMADLAANADSSGLTR
ncbi:hypothetical protein [Nocardioides rubriscoriae]|uniref:hypothetical protein n=1 Tax=Nocardioides rubriscoriae TaxID=642762 RepID=UPI001479106D|nr:hypothetical protein [Nocardioides rubriscoriae]